MPDLRKILVSKDFLSGLIFALLGVGLLWEAQNYPMGSLLRMGPGFFPMIIGSLLALAGVTIAIRAFVSGADEPFSVALAPTFFITIALLVFAFSLQRFGLIVATVLLVIITRLAFRPMHPVGAIVLSMVLVGLAVFIFNYLLQMPIKVLPWS